MLVTIQASCITDVKINYTQRENNMLSAIINILFAITLTQADEGSARYLKNMAVSYGTYNDRITVEWENLNCKSYIVLRSKFKAGPFEQVSQTSETLFSDTTAEKGIKYWYKIIPEFDADAPDVTVENDSLFITDEEYIQAAEKALPVNGTPPADNSMQNKNMKAAEPDTGADKNGNGNEKQPETDVSNLKINNYSGYIRQDKPVPAKLSDLIRLKKGVLKTPADKNEKEIQQKQLEYLKQFYMNQIKFSLLMTMAKPYLEKGQLVILTDCGSYEIIPDKKEFVFYDPSYRYMVILESKKLLKVVSGSQDPALNDIILKNAELFCVYNGETEITCKDGVTRMVYSYDAVGLSTRYLKHDREWKSRTLMVSTSRDELKNRMNEAATPKE